ncbi:MAG TPA: VWA domain-containing protein, partial [Vicinamibacteria bacterium]|nr:VWA domain-containing protein [Vicinamibacteria bacterium]
AVLAQAAAARLGPLSGLSLDDALRNLEAAGVSVIYSTELVRPEMRVAAEPAAARPEEALVEILRPHGLSVRPGPGGRLLVVRAEQTAPPAAADPPRRQAPVFGSEVRLVRLAVTVLDRDGRFVKDLSGDDFEIYEDGLRQTTLGFTRRDVPLSLALVLDSSLSMTGRLSLSKAAAAGFVDGLGAADEASVIQFSDATEVLQGPTTEPGALRQAIERISPGGSTGLYNALYTVLKAVPEPGADSDLRRRVVVLLSDGDDTASLIWEEQVIELARQREATIHVIDLGARDASRRSARVLHLIAAETGGDVHRPQSAADLGAVYARIAEELRSQYMMGYQSTRPPGDARWRNIEVRVRGRAPLRARHRAGYYAQP